MNKNVIFNFFPIDLRRGFVGEDKNEDTIPSSVDLSEPTIYDEGTLFTSQIKTKNYMNGMNAGNLTLDQLDQADHLIKFPTQQHTSLDYVCPALCLMLLQR